MDDVDRALFNSFRVRFELGLFDPIDDQPYWKLGLNQIGTENSTALNRRAASSSYVLLSNPGNILPLTAGKTNIAVVGPHGNATNTLIQADTGRTCPPRNGDLNENDFDCVETPFAAIKRYNSNPQTANVETVFEQGCSLESLSTDGVPAAVKVATSADVVVMGLGIANCGSYCGDKSFPLASCSANSVYARYTEAEAKDRDTIALPTAQEVLAKQVVALGKPTVVFLLNGGMVALPDFLLEAKNVAIVEAFYPGKEGSVGSIFLMWFSNCALLLRLLSVVLTMAMLLCLILPPGCTCSCYFRPH